MKTRLEILDEVNVQFHDVDLKIRRKMADVLKFFIPSAYHTPAYKLGRWDGYVSYFGLGGQTQLNLLDKVLPIIVDAGYEVVIDDKRQSYDFEFPEIHENWFADLGKTWPQGHPAEGQPIVLRDYQISLINEFLQNRQGVQVAATGSGKCLGYETKLNIKINEDSDFGRFLISKLQQEQAIDVTETKSSKNTLD